MYLHFNSSILDYLHLIPPTWSITTVTMKVCSILFTLLDFDQRNRLEKYHIHALLTYLTNMNRSQISTIFYKLDLDQSGAMELEEFFLLISLLLANKDKKEREFMHAHSKTVFDLLDEDNSSTITVEEFRSLGFLFNLDNHQIHSIFKDFDISGDDALDYSEFHIFTLACINKQKLERKKRLQILFQRRFYFLGKQRQSIVKYINKTINKNIPGLIIYEEDETTPSVPLPMNIKIPCQQMKTYIDDDKILSDVFESMSIKSQSF